MAGDKARMGFADPPEQTADRELSGVGSHPASRVHGRLRRADARGVHRVPAGDLGGSIAAVCVDGAIVFTCMDWRHLGEMLAAGEAVFGELKNLIVWNKTSPGQGSSTEASTS